MDHDLIELLVGVAFVAFGIFFWRFADATANYFRKRGSPFLTEAQNDKVYTATGVRWAAGPAFVIGVIMIIVNAHNLAN
ncbi:MAG: hypothetical protein JWQ19_919 [Subtercola sp.]|nr:hypothetical protein [Subtercola sp.]